MNNPKDLEVARGIVITTPCDIEGCSILENKPCVDCKHILNSIVEALTQARQDERKQLLDQIMNEGTGLQGFRTMTGEQIVNVLKDYTEGK